MEQKVRVLSLGLTSQRQENSLCQSSNTFQQIWKWWDVPKIQWSLSPTAHMSTSLSETLTAYRVQKETQLPDDLVFTMTFQIPIHL